MQTQKFGRRLTGTEFLCIPNINTKNPPQPPLKSTPPSPSVMAKGMRGYKFIASELESLAKAVEEIIPISSTEWTGFGTSTILAIQS